MSTLKQTSNIKNGLVGSSVSSTYGAIPPLTVGQVYTTSTGTTAIPNGAYLTSTGANTVWTTGTSTIQNSEVMKINQTDPPTIEVKGNMVINGRDLEERLNTIEKVLQIPERDVKLEKKYPKLKKLYDEYIHALGKYRTFDALKGDNE
jgi:hypothetical protein